MTSFLIIFGPRHSGTNSHSTVNPVVLIGYIFPTIEASFYIEHNRHESHFRNIIYIFKHAMAQQVVLTASSVSKSKLGEEDAHVPSPVWFDMQH